MKTNRFLILFFLWSAICFQANAQWGNIINQIPGQLPGGTDGALTILSETYINFIVTDHEKIAVAYLKPGTRAIASSLPLFQSIPVNDGELHLSINANASYIFVPKGSREFDLNEIGLSELKPKSTNNAMAQTIFGNSSTVGIETIAFYPEITEEFPYFSNIPLAEFESIPGNDQSTITLPYLSIGLEKMNSKFTFTGLYASGDVRFVSVQSQFEQFIPLSEEKNISLMAGMGLSYFQFKADLNILPETSLNYNASDYENQFAYLTMYNMPIKAILIKQKEKLHFGMGAAISGNKAFVDLLGKYPIAIKDPELEYDITVLNITDPVESMEKFVMAQGIATIGYQTDKVGANLNLGFGTMVHSGVVLFYRF